MGRITKVTRRESNNSLDRNTVYKRIIEVLEEAGRAMTAREISEEMYKRKYIPFPVRQAVAPRLTELADIGRVIVCGKVYDQQTKRNVAAYKLAEVTG